VIAAVLLVFCQYCQLVTGYQLFLIINMSVAYAGYVETNREKLTSALYDSLSYKRQPNFVFFKEAVHHAARLSRVLVVILLLFTGFYFYACKLA